MERTLNTYQEFLKSKAHKSDDLGFDPVWMPDFLFDFQAHLVEWAVRKGRGALLADCGLGKTPMSLVWAENVVRKTNKPVLILAPLAVSHQFVREGEKFGIRVHRSQDGSIRSGVNVTNYQRLAKFNPSQVAGVIADESSILKGIDGKTRRLITDFMGKVRYAMLGTATAAPNDYMELGTSSEALGVMPYNQMLGMFFVNDGEITSKWNLKGHGKSRFWQWVSTWARAVRKPSDLGFDDAGFLLPELRTEQHTVDSSVEDGCLFPTLAVTLNEQRRERRATIQSRCEVVASLDSGDRPFLVWCHLNDEGDLLEKLIPDAVQVAGRHSDDEKEDRLDAFAKGEVRVLVTKPKIGGWGLNLQHCSDMTFFPSHSFESYYQCVRRCWRFGQKREVSVHIVTSESEAMVLSNMQRKQRQADEMFSGIVREMHDYQMGNGKSKATLERMEVPEWLNV